jgi:hypothetical protein
MATFADHHVGNGLPLVHGHEPPVFAAVPPTAEIYHQLALVAVERGEDRVKAGLGEGAVGEKKGGDDNLGEALARVVLYK